MILRRAVEVNRPLAVKYADDPQIRFDLAKNYHYLGVLQLELAHRETSIGLFRQAQPISESLVKEFPDEPRYAELLAKHHESLGSSLAHSASQAPSNTFRPPTRSMKNWSPGIQINVDYRIGQAHCLREEALIAKAAGSSRGCRGHQQKRFEETRSQGCHGIDA